MIARKSNWKAFLTCCLCLFALGLFVCGGYEAVNNVPIANHVQAPFDLDDSARDLGSLEVGHHDLVYAVTNTDNQPRRIIGLAESCDLNCCFRSKSREQVIVQPGETYFYQCDLHVRGPGIFSGNMLIYLEENGIRKVELPVRGIGVVKTKLSYEQASTP